jgi:type IV pilus biogenesis protein CpaD/CtpE
VSTDVEKIALAAALATGLAGCASTPPTEQLAAARAMVGQAQPVAAREAPLELSVAQTKLARAEDAMQRSEYEAARRYAEQAEVDARLAWTSAENARAQRAAAEVEQGIQTLRRELDRRDQ